LVKPDVSLVMGDTVFREGDGLRERVVRIGFRNGKPLPTEVIYEYEWTIKEWTTLEGSDVRAGRYFVSESGSVIDLNEKKLINAERYGVVVYTDDTKVTYWIKDEKGKGELFAFEYATKKRTRLERLSSVPMGVPYSPDSTAAIDWINDELTVRRAGKEPKSLGRGFELGPSFRAWTGTEGRDRFDTLQNVLWLDNNRILAHRKAGKIVALSLDGKETDVVTIKNVPEDAITELCRDPGGTIVYSFSPKLDDWPHRAKRFKIDVANKTATPTDGIDLGHGFEAVRDPKLEWRTHVRYNGKKIGQLSRAQLGGAVSAPGYLALPADQFKNEEASCSGQIGVWSVATREWTVFKDWNNTCCGGGILALVK
jgi:hypothetical protein